MSLITSLRKSECTCCLVLACLALVSLVFFAKYMLTSTLAYSNYSPKLVYRLDYYKVSRLQQLLHINYEMPSYVQLRRVDDNKLLGESGIVNLYLNGELNWWLDTGTVRVGMDVWFENIPPEACPPACDDTPKPAVPASDAKP